DDHASDGGTVERRTNRKRPDLYPAQLGRPGFRRRRRNRQPGSTGYSRPRQAVDRRGAAEACRKALKLSAIRILRDVSPADKKASPVRAYGAGPPALRAERAARTYNPSPFRSPGASQRCLESSLRSVQFFNQNGFHAVQKTALFLLVR